MSDEQILGPVEKNCRKHGAYMAAHLVAGVYEPCAKCCDEAEALRAEEEERSARVVQFDREAYRMIKAGVTDRFKDATFDTWVAASEAQQTALEFARNYALRFPANFKAGRSAMFVGKPGTGKTHLGFAILRHCMAASERFDGKMVGVADLFRRIKATWDRGSKESEEQAIKSFVDPHLLIIDEIGVQFGSAVEMNLLYDVVNGRYQKVLPTIVISNLSVKDLRLVVGERVFDRLRENDGGLVVFDWQSHRVRSS